MKTEIKELKESDEGGDAGKDKRHGKWREMLKSNVDLQNRLAELKVRDERRTQEESFLRLNLEEFRDQTELITRE